MMALISNPVSFMNNILLETKSNAASKSVNIMNNFCFILTVRAFNNLVVMTCRFYSPSSFDRLFVGLES